MSDNATNKVTYRNKIWIVFLVDLIFTLLLLIIGIISLKVGNSLPENVDAFMIVGKNSIDDFENDNKKWETKTNINIFQANYVNDENITTIASSTGDKIFAPGAKAIYIFSMLNIADFSVVYEVDVDFTLKIGSEKVDSLNFPFKVRLYNDYGVYLIGNEDEWEYIYDAKLIKHLGTLGSSSYENYNLEIYWEYDGNSDDLDTLLGDYSYEDGVTLLLEINSSAEESLIPLEGGNKIDIEGKQKNVNLLKWLWIILLIINIIIIVIFYIIWSKLIKKKNYSLKMEENMENKRQNNSKKFMAIIAIVIMMGLILGMGAITYSRYVTSKDSGIQSATAAKWGYVISVDASNLFGTNYTKSEGNNLATIVQENGVAVKGSNNALVVAPGTTGSITITIAGSAEVKSKLEFNCTSNDEISLGDYKPVKWNVTGINGDFNGSTLEDVIDALNNEATNLSAGDELNKNYIISWTWEFDNSENNIKDTIIGYKAAEKTYDNLKEIYDNTTLSSIVSDDSAYNNINTTISFELQIAIEQIQ